MCFSVQVDRQLNKVAARFNARVDRAGFEKFLALQSENPKLYKAPDESDRIYPNYYAPVLVKHEGEKLLRPMRYRVRPHDSAEEVPTKYNLFNARIDALEKRKTWASLFMRNHCVLPMVGFFEWVEHEGKKRQINFHPDGVDLMWAPGLWDTWISKDGSERIDSFAIITTEPPPEIERMGHDRCPIFLQEEYLDDWLTPENETRYEVYEMLGQITPTHYSYDWVS